ncbi:MAG: alanine--glyoxylate aminotransferase family protein, partial [Gemmatimonadota bacterium]
FALPPGLAFGVAQKPMLRRMREDRPGRGRYFDLRAFEAGLDRSQTPNTPAVSLLYALDAQLARVHEEGIEPRWARHRAMAERVWEWVDEMRDRGVRVETFAPEGHRSPTVTCVRLPNDTTGPTVCSALRNRGFAVAPGYGSTKDHFIRIGHMGDHTVEELNALLEALEEVFGV